MLEKQKMKPRFSIARKDPELMDLVNKTDKKLLAIWAIDCAERVLPYFEKSYPKDKRPRVALDTLREWIRTGIFKMSVIRKASLDSHASAREVGEDNPARSACRACGQAVATAHVARHSYGSAIYAQQAIYRAIDSVNVNDINAAIKEERDWQYNHLLLLRKKYNSV
jgi:hypothetical protein